MGQSMRKKFPERFPGRGQCEREILSLLVSRFAIEKSPSNFLSHASNGGTPIGRDFPRVHLRRAVPLRSIVTSHRSVIKNDKGKWDRRRFSRALARYKLLARCTELDGN